MSVMMVRQKVKEGSVDVAEAAARDLFAMLARAARRHPLRVDAGGGQLNVRDTDRTGRRQRGSAAGDPRVPAVPGAAPELGGRPAGDRAPQHCCYSFTINS